MELKQLLKVILRRWWLVALPSLIVGVLTLTSFNPSPVTYQVVMRLATGSSPADEISPDYDRYYAWLTSEYIANGLADLALTDAFAQRVSQRLASLDIEIPPSAIRPALASDNVQSITVIYVTWSDLDQIVPLALAVSDEIIEDGGIYFPQMAEVGVVARRLDEPVPVALSPSLRAQLTGPALRILLAALVGIGLALLSHVFDPTVRELEDITSRGIKLLGQVPKPYRKA